MTFSSETQMTQQGQAIRLNCMALNSLAQVFESNIGPKGTFKVLITPSGAMKVTKDGSVISKEIQFTHPTAIIVNRQITSMATEIGDGTSSFVVLLNKIFSSAFNYYMEGSSIHKIIESLEEARRDILEFIKQSAQPLNDQVIKKMISTSLNTKIESENLSEIIFQAIENVKGNSFLDLNMIEIMKMPGDKNVQLIDGLVLDHGNRHHGMPTLLEDCAILITNLSLEYEKPEINSGFYYSTPEEREIIVKTERDFIIERAKAIASFSKKVGKNLVVITERGIDPFSLEILASENILGLRRAKRRNLERLIKMCGGNIISRIDELTIENLGFARKVSVVTKNEEKFTFIEGTPFKSSCTILIQNDNQIEVERIQNAIKSSFRTLTHALKDKVFIEGGYKLYFNLFNFISGKKNSVGYKILKESYYDFLKVLIKNNGLNIEETLGLMERNEFDYEFVPESIAVVLSVLINSIVYAVNLLLIDEIIKAGKPIKEEKGK